MTGKMIIKKGDATNPTKLYDNEISIIPHVCNNKNRWGAGFVLALNKKWPIVEEKYREIFEQADLESLTKEKFEESILGEYQIVFVEKRMYVLNMIAQDGTGREGEKEVPIRYYSLAKCMNDFVTKNKHLCGSSPLVFHCPMFGAGLAGGDFEFVKELMRECWLENSCDVVIYEFVPRIS